jgi:hypothetical protein
MFISISVFIFCAILALVIESSDNKALRNRLTLICLAVLALVSGTRLVGGSDFAIYENHYRLLATFPDALNPAMVDQNYEIGYTYIAAFFKTLGVSFYGFCLICSSFFCFALWKGLSRYTDHLGFVILIFLYKLFFYNTMISMRQSITVACFFLMLPLIENKKILLYYIVAFLVSRIHNGALILFVLYPLVYISLSKKRILLLNLVFIPTILIGFAEIDVLGPIGAFFVDHATNDMMVSKAEFYFANENLSPIGIFHTLEFFVIMSLLFRNIDCFDLDGKQTRTIVWLFLCLLPLFTLLRGSEVLTREKDYFTIFYAVLLGHIVDCKPKTKGLLTLFILVLCTFGYYRFLLLFDNGALMHYQSWLFNPDYSIFIE